MTNEAQKPPVRKPSAAQGKKPGAKPASKGKPPAKKPPMDLAAMIKKIPLPYLGGGIAGIVMVLYVVFTAMTAPMPAGAPVAQQRPPQAQESRPPQAQAEEQAAQESGAGASMIPGYAGPSEVIPDAPISTDLPLIPRIGDDLKALGREVKMTKDGFEKISRQYDTEDLDGDPFLAYRVRVPETWTFMGPRQLKDMQLNNQLMGIMALYLSPADLEMRSSLRIKAQRMTHMMSARDWTYHYAFGNRYTLQALSTYGDDRAEAVYVITEMDITYVVRMAVIISGARVVTAEYFVPMQKYEEEKDIQTWGITSFYLKKKDKTTPEPTKALYFFDIASTTYPESWAVQSPNITSIDQMHASVVNMRVREDKPNEPSILRGRVDVYLFATSEDYSEIDAIKKINEQFEGEKVQIGKKLGRFLPTENLNGLKGQTYTVYEVNDDANSYQDYQYWVAVLKGNNYYFYVCLLTPPRDTDMYNWSRNLGAFEHVIKAMKEGI